MEMKRHTPGKGGGRGEMQGGSSWIRIPWLVVLLVVIQPGAGSMASGSDSAGRSGPGLVLSLEVGKDRVYQGESVPFTVTLSHTFPSPASVITLADANRSLKLVLKAPGGKTFTADQMSHQKRDGLVFFERDEPEVTSLEPGQKLRAGGDMLQWLGHIPAGRYVVEMTYTEFMRTAKSKQVSLTVLPLPVTGLKTARCEGQAERTPLASAWTGRDKNTTLIFSGLLSPHVASNTNGCVQAARVKGRIFDIGPACTSVPGGEEGAVYWMDSPSKISFTIVDLKSGHAGKPVRAALPFDAKPAGSPLLLRDGTLLVPFAVRDTDILALAWISSSGGITLHRYTLEGLAGQKGLTCFWEDGTRLVLFWIQEDRTAVSFAHFSLKNPARGFSKVKSLKARGRVLWLAPYLDRSIPQDSLRSLYLGEGSVAAVEALSPRVRLWLVTDGQDGISCSRMDADKGLMGKPQVLKPGRARNLAVVDSAVTKRYGLALLMKDARDSLFYGSTTGEVIEPLDKITGKKVIPKDHPQLLASRTGPWVHLQHVDRGKAVGYVRLEPRDEPDPVEKWKEGR